MGNSKQWREKNPKRWKEHQLNYRKRQRYENPNKCVICARIIPYGSKKHTPYKLCSNKCREIKRKINQKSLRHKQFKIFEEYKLSIGCALCGYRKCPACLDFHHVTDKKFRIDASRFYSMSDTVIDEIQKCILLCKNCHYEIHCEGCQDKKIKENGDVE